MDILQQDARRVAESDFIDWKRLDGKTLFITGATGFIGSCLIRALMYRSLNYGEKIKIAALVRNVPRAKEMFRQYLDTGLMEFVQGDVIENINYGGSADYVIHCASNAAPKEYSEDPVGTMKTNFYGTFNMLELAKRCGSEKFLYVSTIEIYGNTDKGETPENLYGSIDPLNPRSCYPISKKACETAAVCFSAQFDLNVSIARLSYIFGAGIKKDDSKIVAILTRAAAHHEDLVLKSKGDQIRSYTYISDAISGLITVLLSGQNRQAYNIASSLCVSSIANIAKTLADLYKHDGVTLRFDIPTEEEKSKFSPIKDSVLSNIKLKSLGWSDLVDLPNGLNFMTLFMNE